MSSSHTTSVLLVGARLRNIDRMIAALKNAGAELYFAEGLADAGKLMGSIDFDVIVCHSEFSQRNPAEFSGLMYSARNIAGIPLVVAGEPLAGIDGVFASLRDGAADFCSEHFHPDAFIGKLVWIIEKGSSERARRRRYELLRRSQMQTLEIVRETALMFDGLDSDRDDFDERVEIGLAMIAGLAGILREQIKIVDNWFDVQSRTGGQPPVDPAAIESERSTARNAELALLV